MKNILFLLLMSASVIITGCSDKHEFPYRYAHGEQVPDSSRDDMAKFITETMRASNQNLTTSDYEDVDDVVSVVTYTAEKIYTTSVDGLDYNDPNYNGEYWKFIPYNQLTDKQKIIFDSLKVNQQ